MFKQLVSGMIIFAMILMVGCDEQPIKEKVIYEPNIMQELFTGITTDMTRYEIQEYCTNFIQTQEDTLFYVGRKDKYGLSYLDYDSDQYEITVNSFNLNLSSVEIISKNTFETIRIEYNWDYSERGHHVEASYKNESDEYTIWLFNEYDGENGPSSYRYLVFDDNFEYGGPEKRFNDDSLEIEFSQPKDAFQYIYDAIY